MDGAAQKQETAVGNMWRLENKGGMGGYFFFVYIYAASNDDQIKGGMDGYMQQAI
jgi:hypothetical protein